MRVPTRKAEQDRRALQGNDPIYVTHEGIEKIKRQIKRIEDELPAAIAELQRTREMGDLSENAAYQEAKHQVRRMQSKHLQLTERLKNVIEIQKSISDKVQLGSTVHVTSDRGEQQFNLVGPLEANPLKGRISHKSPLGQALLGSKEDQEVIFNSPAGEKRYRIIKID